MERPTTAAAVLGVADALSNQSHGCVFLSEEQTIGVDFKFKEDAKVIIVSPEAISHDNIK